MRSVDFSSLLGDLRYGVGAAASGWCLEATLFDANDADPRLFGEDIANL